MIVVSNDDRTEPFSASQFQPPSSSCSPSSRSTIALDVLAEVGAERDGPAVDARLDLAVEEALAVVLPAAVLPDQGHRLPRRGRPRVEAEVAEQHQGEEGRRPGLTVRRTPGPPAGKKAPPAHWPSGSRSASSRAPQPSVATRARSAATTSAGASVRSCSTCQRMAGSESSSQSSTVMAGTVPRRHARRDATPMPGHMRATVVPELAAGSAVRTYPRRWRASSHVLQRRRTR